ncbi:MAG: hypothetical protein RMY34_15165 [Aulosira sp. DedQUE10]|nr:hypothetical protein [Aulosira sp. DedQUE10]
MPNPKGHPESLEPHKFKSGGDEPLTEQLNIRIPRSLHQRLQQLYDKAEFCRDAIKKALDEHDASAS